MIHLRTDSSGAVFLVREGEENAAFERLRQSYPGSPIDLLQRCAGLLLVRVVAKDGTPAPATDLVIGRVELKRPLKAG